jgi:hypothetical protein
MKSFLGFALAILLGLLTGVAYEASRSHAGVPSLGHWVRGETPAVSAAPARPAQDDRVQFAADVEVEGRRFRVYVGRSDNVAALPVWSVAVPSDE